MSDTTDLGERLARHLAGTASEAESEQLEREALENDLVFDQLEALESELVAAYARGELDEETGHGIADLLAASPRLQGVLDTTLALEIRSEDTEDDGTRQPDPTAVRAPVASPIRQAPVVKVALAGLLLVVVVLGLWLARLDGTARALGDDNASLRRQAAELQEELTRLEESNRALALRLARIEAKTAPAADRKQ